jgi:hypothetical protein
MPTTKEIQDFVTALAPAQMRFIRDMNSEELEYFSGTANNQYEALANSAYTNKLRILNEDLKESSKKEDRTLTDLEKFFNFLNAFAEQTDKAIGEFARERLWISQSPFSKEAALLESIMDRLLRSSGPALPISELENEPIV